jgi:hypothetical protein
MGQEKESFHFGSGRANEEKREANPGRRDYGTNLFLVVHPAPAFRSIPRSVG